MILVVFLFMDINKLEEFVLVLNDLSGAFGLISFPFGWLLYQIFEEFCLPHYKTTSFKLVRDKCPDLKKTECFALVDYILMDDMYKKYSGLAGTIGGYWDNYYASSIIGLGAPIFSTLSFIILLVVEKADCTNCIICPCDSALRFICLVFLIIYNVSLYSLLWEVKAKRIFKEIEFQECLHVRNNIYKLEDNPLRFRMANCSHLLTKNNQNK